MSISEYLKKSGTFILPGYFYAYRLSFYQWLRFLPLLQKSWWKKKCKDISLEAIEYKCELDRYQICNKAEFSIYLEGDALQLG